MTTAKAFFPPKYRVEAPLANLINSAQRSKLLSPHEIHILMAVLENLPSTGSPCWLERWMRRAEEAFVTHLTDPVVPDTTGYEAMTEYINWAISLRSDAPFVRVLMQQGEDLFVEWLDSHEPAAVRALLANDVIRVKLAMAALLVNYEGPLRPFRVVSTRAA